VSRQADDAAILGLSGGTDYATVNPARVGRRIFFLCERGIQTERHQAHQDAEA
jgi:hypothetical protein